MPESLGFGDASGVKVSAAAELATELSIALQVRIPDDVNRDSAAM